MTALLMKTATAMTAEGQEFEDLHPEADHQGAGPGAQDHGADKAGQVAAQIGQRPVAPKLVGQVGGQKISPKAEETAHAQGAEKVADEVAEGRAPGPRRAEEEAEDHGNDVGGPQFREPRDEGDALEGDEDGGEDPGGEHRQHHHGRIIPHAPDFPHPPRLPEAHSTASAPMGQCKLWGPGPAGPVREALVKL